MKRQFLRALSHMHSAIALLEEKGCPIPRTGREPRELFESAPSSSQKCARLTSLVIVGVILLATPLCHASVHHFLLVLVRITMLVIVRAAVPDALFVLIVQPVPQTTHVRPKRSVLESWPPSSISNPVGVEVGRET